MSKYNNNINPMNDAIGYCKYNSWLDMNTSSKKSPAKYTYRKIYSNKKRVRDIYKPDIITKDMFIKHVIPPIATSIAPPIISPIPSIPPPPPKSTFRRQTNYSTYKQSTQDHLKQNVENNYSLAKYPYLNPLYEFTQHPCYQSAKGPTTIDKSDYKLTKDSVDEIFFQYEQRKQIKDTSNKIVRKHKPSTSINIPSPPLFNSPNPSSIGFFTTNAELYKSDKVNKYLLSYGDIVKIEGNTLYYQYYNNTTKKHIFKHLTNLNKYEYDLTNTEYSLVIPSQLNYNLFVPNTNIDSKNINSNTRKEVQYKLPVEGYLSDLEIKEENSVKVINKLSSSESSSSESDSVSSCSESSSLCSSICSNVSSEELGRLLSPIKKIPLYYKKLCKKYLNTSSETFNEISNEISSNDLEECTSNDECSSLIFDDEKLEVTVNVESDIDCTDGDCTEGDCTEGDCTEGDCTDGIDGDIDDNNMVEEADENITTDNIIHNYVEQIDKVESIYNLSGSTMRSEPKIIIHNDDTPPSKIIEQLINNITQDAITNAINKIEKASTKDMPVDTSDKITSDIISDITPDVTPDVSEDSSNTIDTNAEDDSKSSSYCVIM